MCSPGVSARDRVLAELAGLGPRAADAFRPGAADPVSLLGALRDLAVFADQVNGELARLAGVLDAVEGAGEAGYKSVAGFLRHACGRSPGRAGELVAAGRALRRLEATGQASMAGEISFDAAHVICRALAQISDEALVIAAEQQMLAYARSSSSAPPGPAQMDDGPGHGHGREHGQPGDGQPSTGSGQEDRATGHGGSGTGHGGPGTGCPGPDADPVGPDAGHPGSDADQPGPDGYPGPDGEPCPGGGPAAGAGGPSGPGAAWTWPAPGLDPTQLRVLGEDLIYRADPEAVEERERRRFERRHLSFGFTLENTGTIHGACGDTLSLEIIKTAVHAFGPPGGTEDTRTAAQRRMDGLTAACQAALDSGAAGTRHGAAPHLSVLVHEQTLAQAAQASGQAGPAGGWGADRASGAANGYAGGYGGYGGDDHRRWDQAGGHAGDAAAGQARARAEDGKDQPSGTAGPGTPSPTDGCATAGPRTAGAMGGCGARAGSGSGSVGPTSGPAGRRAPGPLGPPPARTGFGATLTARQVLALACHAELSIIRWSDGIPLDVGRRYRTETPAIRRALEARDQGCRAPGCGMPATWCTAHHLKPWSHGGTTSLNDTALFCFAHHTYFIHTLGWTVTGDPNGTLHFTHPQGWPTLDSPLPGATKPRPP